MGGGDGKGKRGGDGDGGTQFMRGHSRMTIRPSHPYYAGAEHVGVFTSRADIACTKREAP